MQFRYFSIGMSYNSRSPFAGGFHGADRFFPFSDPVLQDDILLETARRQLSPEFLTYSTAPRVTGPLITGRLSQRHRRGVRAGASRTAAACLLTPRPCPDLRASVAQECLSGALLANKAWGTDSQINSPKQRGVTPAIPPANREREARLRFRTIS